MTTLLPLLLFAVQSPQRPRLLSAGSWPTSDAPSASRMVGFRTGATRRANDLNLADELVLVRHLGAIRVESRQETQSGMSHPKSFVVERFARLDGGFVTVVSPQSAYFPEDVERPLRTDGVFLLAVRRASSGLLRFRDGNLSPLKDFDETVAARSNDERAGILLLPTASARLVVGASASDTILRDAAFSLRLPGSDEVRTISRFLANLDLDDFRPRSLVDGKTVRIRYAPTLLPLLRAAAATDGTPYVSMRRLVALDRIGPGEADATTIEAMSRFGKELGSGPLPEEDRSFLQDLRLTNPSVTSRVCLDAASTISDPALRFRVIAQIVRVTPEEAGSYVRLADDPDADVAWLALHNLSWWSGRQEMDPGDPPRFHRRPAAYDDLSRAWTGAGKAELERALATHRG